MKTTQIIVLGLAVAAAGGAYWAATNLVSEPQAVQATAQAPVVIRAETTKVLVAGERIQLGEALRQERLTWQEWPKSGLTEGFITEEMEAKAPETYAAMVARSMFYVGEPIRKEKLVQSDRGYLSAILPRGARAVAISVEAVTSAGGFVLPNDHVDVMLTTSDSGVGGGNDVSTEVLLSNIRVLAVDQVIEEKEDGSKSVIGDTATLQVTPEQAEELTRARTLASQGGSLSLVLRSVEDSTKSAEDATRRRSNSNMTLIRYGKSQTVRPRR